MARKRRIGTVLSDINNKTIIVGVDWTQRDPVYGKSKKRITRFSASDINNSAKTGDTKNNVANADKIVFLIFIFPSHFCLQTF